MSNELALVPLDAAAFTGYGEVVEQPSVGALARYGFVNDRGDAHIDLIAARPAALHLPLVVASLECHPHSSQSFLPLDVATYLVVVAHDTGTGQPDLATLRAFRADGTQGVNFAPGTWHRSVAALGQAGSFATVTCYAGTSDDIVTCDISPTRIVEES